MTIEQAGSKPKGGRPSRFSDRIAADALAYVAGGFTRREIAERCGIGLRTLQDWLARGRAGEPALATWAARYDAIARAVRADRVRQSYERRRAADRERWRRFKASREGWWLRRLGPARFWTLRLNWLLEHGKYDAYRRTVARLEGQDFRTFRAP
jgi:transposase